MNGTLPVGYCFESAVRSHHVAGLRLLESRYAPGQSSLPHVHGAASFCLVLDGRFEHVHRGETVRCEHRSLLFYQAGEPHAERFLERGARCFILELSTPWLRRLRELDGEGPRSGSLVPGPAANLAWRVYQEIREPDGLAALMIEGLTLELLGEALRHDPSRSPGRRTPASMDRARDMIHAAAPGPVSLAAIAAELGMHPVHVAQAFRRAHGCSVGQYSRRLRLDLACRRLATSDEPLGEIAIATGFYDQSHMTREFRRALKTTPARYRAAVGGQ